MFLFILPKIQVKHKYSKRYVYVCTYVHVLLYLVTSLDIVQINML